MGPQNGIMGGDANYGTDLPQTQLPPEAGQDISRERNMARFSKSAEFKVLKELMQARQAYHKKYSPGSQGETAFRDMPNDERGWRSLAADLVIEELQMIIDAYETANEVVKDAQEATKRRQRPQGSVSSGTA